MDRVCSVQNRYTGPAKGALLIGQKGSSFGSERANLAMATAQLEATARKGLPPGVQPDWRPERTFETPAHVAASSSSAATSASLMEVLFAAATPDLTANAPPEEEDGKKHKKAKPCEELCGHHKKGGGDKKASAASAGSEDTPPSETQNAKNSTEKTNVSDEVAVGCCPYGAEGEDAAAPPTGVPDEVSPGSLMEVFSESEDDKKSDDDDDDKKKKKKKKKESDDKDKAKKEKERIEEAKQQKARIEHADEDGRRRRGEGGGEDGRRRRATKAPKLDAAGDAVAKKAKPDASIPAQCRSICAGCKPPGCKLGPGPCKAACDKAGGDGGREKKPDTDASIPAQKKKPDTDASIPAECRSICAGCKPPGCTLRPGPCKAACEKQKVKAGGDGGRDEKKKKCEKCKESCKESCGEEKPKVAPSPTSAAQKKAAQKTEKVKQSKEEAIKAGEEDKHRLPGPVIPAGSVNEDTPSGPKPKKSESRELTTPHDSRCEAECSKECTEEEVSKAPCMAKCKKKLAAAKAPCMTGTSPLGRPKKVRDEEKKEEKKAPVPAAKTEDEAAGKTSSADSSSKTTDSSAETTDSSAKTTKAAAAHDTRCEAECSKECTEEGGPKAPCMAKCKKMMADAKAPCSTTGGASKHTLSGASALEVSSKGEINEDNQSEMLVQEGAETARVDVDDSAEDSATTLFSSVARGGSAPTDASTGLPTSKLSNVQKSVNNAEKAAARQRRQQHRKAISDSKHQLEEEAAKSRAKVRNVNTSLPRACLHAGSSEECGLCVLSYQHVLAVAHVCSLVRTPVVM